MNSAGQRILFDRLRNCAETLTVRADAGDALDARDMQQLAAMLRDLAEIAMPADVAALEGER